MWGKASFRCGLLGTDLVGFSNLNGLEGCPLENRVTEELPFWGVVCSLGCQFGPQL